MLKGLLISAVVPILSLLAVAPSGATYSLQSYGIGSGGVANASSANYSMNGITGELSGLQLDGTTYSSRPGLTPTQQANVPPAPTFTNPGSYYNTLHLVIHIGGNPSDTKFAVAISSDNFATTQYLQNDDTISSALGNEDYQTYALWGSGAGIDVVGLRPNTTYTVKVKAMQGVYSESAYGPQLPAGVPVAPVAQPSSETTGRLLHIGYGRVGVVTFLQPGGKLQLYLLARCVWGGTLL